MLKVFLIFSIFGQFSASSDLNSWASGTFVPGICLCAPTGSCSHAADSDPDEDEMIETRVFSVSENPKSNLGSNQTLCQPVSTGIPLVAKSTTNCASELESCCPAVGYSCGIRYPPVASAPKPAFNQAAYGAYPYQAVILTFQNSLVASGALIDQYHVLTVAHKVSNLTGQLKARLGDWDAVDSYEPLEVFESNVSVSIHPNFNPKNLKNDIAILRLSTMAPLGQYPTIGTVCLPNTTLGDIVCWVSGWGKNETGVNGHYQRIIKETELPLIDYPTCQKLFQKTRLGPDFMLDKTSFVCAGGKSGKDACTGDGGAPLSCFVDGRFYLHGLVAWGLDCGVPNVPGVYVNIQSYVPWIQNMTKELSAVASLIKPVVKKIRVMKKTTSTTKKVMSVQATARKAAVKV